MVGWRAGLRCLLASVRLMEGGPGEIRLSEGEVTPADPCSGVAEGAEGIDVLVWGSGHGRGAQACRRWGEGYRDGAFA